MALCRVGSGQHQHVGIGDFLLLVGQFQELLIQAVEFLLVVDVDTEYMETELQGRTTRPCGEHNGVVVESHVLRIHDFIGMNVLQHTVLVYAARVGKSVAAHHSLVGLNGHIHQRAHHTGYGIDLRGVDIGLDTKVLMALQYHGNLLKGCVAGALAYSVDSHLYLTRTVHHAA